MKMARTTKIQGQHFAGLIALVIVLGLLATFRNPVTDWLSPLLLIAGIADLVWVLLAFLGIGPFGKQLTEAARQDERDSWTHNRRE